MIVTLGSLSYEQTNVTKKTTSHLTKFLDYLATKPNATIRYKARDM